jgi:hypothetical protein
MILLAFLAGIHATPVVAIEPPARYRGTPEITVKVVRTDSVSTLCRNAEQSEGCAYLGEQLCLVVIRRDISASRYAEVLRHELAHCRGWPGHHPHELRATDLCLR